MTANIIEITDQAARQIELSARSGDMEGMCLRIAVTRNEDGSFHYAMGFDEARDDDTRQCSQGIDLLIAPTSIDLLRGTVVDFVELDGGNHEFIFLNPNDPAYVPPTDR